MHPLIPYIHVCYIVHSFKPQDSIKFSLSLAINLLNFLYTQNQQRCLLSWGSPLGKHWGFPGTPPHFLSSMFNLEHLLQTTFLPVIILPVGNQHSLYNKASLNRLFTHGESAHKLWY